MVRPVDVRVSSVMGDETSGVLAVNAACGTAADDTFISSGETIGMVELMTDKPIEEEYVTSSFTHLL